MLTGCEKLWKLLIEKNMKNTFHGFGDYLPVNENERLSFAL